MISNSLAGLLAQGSTGQPPGFWMTIPLILGCIAMFVITTSSQRKRTKQHEALVKTLKAGDKVTTSGGIVGIVVTVKDKTVSIRSADTKLEVLKSAISEITEREGEPSQSPS